MDFRQFRSHPPVAHILEERARALMEQERATTTEQGEPFLAFFLGPGGYTIPAHFVREVQPLGDYTPLPHTPPSIIGLRNVRGRLVAVLDIRPLLDIPPSPAQPTCFLVLLTVNGVDVGLLADRVSQVERGAGPLAPALSATADGAAGWVLGIDQQLHLVLDLPGLLADPRLHFSNSSHAGAA